MSCPSLPRREGLSASAVIGEDSLGYAVSGDAAATDGYRAFGGFGPGDVGREGVARVVIEQLEDHAFSPPG